MLCTEPKKELSKTALFGPVAADEYKSCMLESAHYDAATGTYATLMLHRQGDK
jgi:hypothetical protein